jgi:endonuclease/exonuclease/phosphatase family metal-dependent hydrolase
VHRRGIALCLLLALLLPVTTAPAERGRPLRVVTFNLLHGGPSSGLIGDGEALESRLVMVIDELRRLGPDVVALQEASVGRGRGNVAERIAGALGLQHVYTPATTRVLPVPFVNEVIAWLMNFSAGPAVLSRYPITASEVHDLPRCVKRLDPRVLLQTEIATPWGPLAVFSTHTARDDCQVARVGEIVRARAASGPALLMGDLNTGERAAAFQALTNGGGFVDAFRAANPDAPGLTVWQRVRIEEPTVFRRVDYVLMAGVRHGPAAACTSRVVLDRPGRATDGSVLWPSDHYGVLADLDVFGIKCAP